jgi:hypothetical protein
MGEEFSMNHEPSSKIMPLANDFVKVFESPDPESMYTYSPGIAVLPNGRIVATIDIGGPGVERLSPPEQLAPGDRKRLGKVFVSDDGGRTWLHKTDFPYVHARPFVAGDALYVLGQCGDLAVIRSTDEGETWSKPTLLSSGEHWHQAPSNVHYANGHVYLVMERVVRKMKGWPVSVMAPVLMRGRTDADLTQRDSWTFASELVFEDVVPEAALDYFGVPFYEVAPHTSILVAPKRGLSPMGWLETNVVQITDPNHYFYDPSGRTFHLWMRAHTGGTGYANIAKVVENADGSMTTMLEKAPSGRTIAFVPCPGGQMKFHIVYDQPSGVYWLLSSQATDSMTRAELLPADRYNLPNNERHRLTLHFSRNCIDWCFAGLVAVGGSAKQSRHYASMAVSGDDLLVLSRSGDERAKDAHNGNFISFHRIANFRGLIY